MGPTPDQETGEMSCEHSVVLGPDLREPESQRCPQAEGLDYGSVTAVLLESMTRPDEAWWFGEHDSCSLAV